MSALAKMAPHAAREAIRTRLSAGGGQAASKTSLPETLVRLNRLDAAAVEQVKTAQSRLRKPFGQTALQLGLISAHDLEYALGVQLGMLAETDEAVRIPPSLVLVRKPYSPAADEFRRLRARLLTSVPAEELKLFSISSAERTIGGGPAAANFATALAQVGRRVLLVDANLKRPTLGALFGDPNGPGLHEVLARQINFESAASATLVKSLDLLPGGAVTPDPHRLFMSKEFATVIDRAVNAYDHVIFLTAPHNGGGDEELVWAATKRVFVTARKHHVRASVLRDMRNVVRGANASILGAAFIA